MINTGTYSDADKELEYISINLADKRHENRVINFLEKFSLINDQYLYSIEAKWTSSKYHPDMLMTEDEFLEFASAVEALAQKILDRK